MAKEFTKEDRYRAFQRLPEVAKEYITSDKVVNAYHAVQESFGLRVDNMGVLSEETANLMVGLVNPQEYSARLASFLSHLPQEELDGIVRDINEKILSPLREELKDLWSSSAVTKDATPHTEAVHEEQIDRDTLVREIEKPRETTDDDLAGLERSMPRDVQQAQGGATKNDMAKSGLFDGVSRIVEEKMTKQTSSSSSYRGTDPYREPLE